MTNITKFLASCLQAFAGAPGTVEASQLFSEARAAPLATAPVVTDLI